MLLEAEMETMIFEWFKDSPRIRDLSSYFYSDKPGSSFSINEEIAIFLNGNYNVFVPVYDTESDVWKLEQAYFVSSFYGECLELNMAHDSDLFYKQDFRGKRRDFSLYDVLDEILEYLELYNESVAALLNGLTGIYEICYKNGYCEVLESIFNDIEGLFWIRVNDFIADIAEKYLSEIKEWNPDVIILSKTKVK